MKGYTKMSHATSNLKFILTLKMIRDLKSNKKNTYINYNTYLTALSASEFLVLLRPKRDVKKPVKFKHFTIAELFAPKDYLQLFQLLITLDQHRGVQSVVN